MKKQDVGWKTLDLWSRFMAGEDLSPEDQHALLEALESDEMLRGRCLEDALMDGMLRGFGIRK